MQLVVPIEKIIENPQNPRTISEDQFEKLCNSIKEDPSILEAKRLVVEQKGDLYMVLGGNMRLKALKHLKYTDVPIFDATNWSAETKRRFVVKDNISSGVWNYDELANQYDLSELESWGFSETLRTYEDPEEKETETSSVNTPKLSVTFTTNEDLENAKVEIQAVVDKYAGAVLT